MSCISRAVFAALLWWLPLFAFAQDAASATESEDADAVPIERAIEASDLSAYVDGMVDAAMKREGIAGVTVAVVDREGPLLLRGYGVAGLSPRREVDPEHTLFRIASISKTFAYLLALKQVDAGQIELDRPVNDYLPQAIQLPDDGLPPVRVRHLLTHTAGFEDSALGHLFVDQADKVLSQHEYLKRHRPARVRAPDTFAVYSNYSVALLGALVAHVAGTDFETLAERELFEPMAMSWTTFREPGLPDGDSRRAHARFDGTWSDGFQRSAGSFKPQTFQFVGHGAPAGGASSTAADMGRYMRMLLRGGELDGVQVLSASAHARLLAEPMFRNAASVGGFSYGFFASHVGRYAALGHGGATSWFFSDMTVVPELGVGIFVSTNTNTGRRFSGEFAGQILERYFEAARGGELPVAPQGFDGQRFAGNYSGKRSNYSQAEKALLSSTTAVSVADDGSLLIASGGPVTRWIPEGGLVFRQAEGQGRIEFYEDASGRIAGYASPAGHNVFERIGPLDNVDHLFLTLAATGALALLVLVGAWLRRGRRQQASPQARRAAFWLYVTALAWLSFVIALGLYAQQGTSDTVAILYRYPGTLLTVLLWCSPVLMLLAATNLLRLPSVWRGRGWNLWRRLRHTLVVVVFAFAGYMLWHWNLVGWKL